MEHDITDLTVRLVLQLGVVLLAAKVGAEISERYLHQPSVLGELVAGILIGPYAFGGLALPFVGPLFPIGPGSAGGSASAVPVSPELWSFAQVGAVVLLFTIGLETDFGQFLRYSGPAVVVAIGGVLLPFALGAGAAILLGEASGPTSPVALFIGAIMTATSIGITARVLSDLRQLGTPEGITVLASAVIDDVLGILLVAMVAGLAGSGEASLAQVGIVAGKSVGFWLVLTAAGIALSGHVSRLLTGLRSDGAAIAVALALAFLCAGLAEVFGLAMIIGAYSIGLALSRTELAEIVRRPLAAVYQVLAPIFFVVMGTMVDYRSMTAALGFALVISLLAIIGKIGGCGLPALAAGFNRWGALRIGIGMLPRGEVALIVAQVGLVSGAIDQRLFGVAIFMTLVTTVLAPIALVPAFRHGGSGRARPRRPAGQAPPGGKTPAAEAQAGGTDGARQPGEEQR